MTCSTADGDRSRDPLGAARVASAQAGDEDALAWLVRAHSDQLYRIALRMTGDAQDAQDVVQATFIQAWQHLPAFRGDARFSTWVTRILINRCHNLYRAHRPVHPLLSETEPAPGSLQTAAAETLVVTEHRRQAVRPAVLALPINQRAPLVLTTFGGHTLAETGRILGISEGAAKVRVHRSRRALSLVLRDWE